MATKKPPTGSSRDAALMAISTSLASLQRGYRAAVDKAVAHAGLSQALALPIVVIGRQGDGLRPGVLAGLLGIEGPSLVRSLAQLVEAGLVEYREDAVDGRAKTLHLTAAGAAVRVKIEAVLRELRTSLYEGVPDEDLEACLRVFATLEQRLGRKPSVTLGIAPLSPATRATSGKAAAAAPAATIDVETPHDGGTDAMSTRGALQEAGGGMPSSSKKARAS